MNQSRVVSDTAQPARQSPLKEQSSSQPTQVVHGTLYGMLSRLGYSESDVLLRVEVDAVGPSMNEFYGRMHWRKRDALVKQWHGLAYSYIAQHQQPAITIPTECVMFCTFRPGRQAQDGINLSPTCKMLEDGLVSLQLIPEDTDAWVAMHHLAGRSGQADHTTLLYMRRL